MTNKLFNREPKFKNEAKSLKDVRLSQSRSNDDNYTSDGILHDTAKY